MKVLIRNFLNGCLVIIPAAVSVYVMYAIFVRVDGLLAMRVPGLGFFLTLALITAVGALARNVVGKRVVGMADRALARLPLVKLIYTALRDFMGALLGDKKTFDRPVAVNVSEDGALKVFGFMTHEELARFGLAEHVAVYVPQSINFAGQLLLVPRGRVQPLEAQASELLPFIVSGGMAGGATAAATN